MLNSLSFQNYLDLNFTGKGGVVSGKVFSLFKN